MLSKYVSLYSYLYMALPRNLSTNIVLHFQL